MSYTFLRATGGAYSAESFAEMFQSAPWKSTNDAGKLYYNVKEMEFCHGFQYGTKSKHLMESHGEELQKSSVEDFHAPIFRQQELIVTSTESRQDLMEKALDCGLKWQELLKKFNLKLFVLKTPRIYELKDLCESSKTLTAWGITQEGVCLDVGTSAQTIIDEECLLLPTPTSHNSKEGAYPAEFTRNTPTLAAQIGGKINPDWNEWRMGCPTKWSDLKPLGIDKFQQWLRSHGKL